MGTPASLSNRLGYPVPRTETTEGDFWGWESPGDTCRSPRLQHTESFRKPFRERRPSKAA